LLTLLVLKRRSHHRDIKFFTTKQEPTMSTFFWQVAPELDVLRRQVDSIFEAVNPASQGAESGTRRPVATWKPSAAIHETADRYIIQLQLPGIDAESLDIEASRDAVVVKGDRPAPTVEGLIHSEFRYGPFERSFALPLGIQHQQVEAAYDQGILTLTLLKQVADDDRVVKVSLAGRSV
jgi:HSP20 family protein